MQDRSRFYMFCREHGFLTVFLLHFVLYGITLYIMINKLVVNQVLLSQMVYGSFTFLVASMFIIFKRCLDDVNLRYYDVCFSMVLTRCFVYQLKHFGLYDPYWILVFSIGLFALFTLILYLRKKFKFRRLSRIPKALFP